MSWWGTVLGGTLGYMFGGPLGAVLGAAIGRNFDHGLQNAGTHYNAGDQRRVQAAFFTATFSVMGHIAKSDGRVSNHEILTARQIMDQMQLNADQRQVAQNLFNSGKSAAFSLDEVLQQFKFECHRRSSLLRMFLEIQIAVAMADGELHTNERKILHHIGHALGFEDTIIDDILNFTQRAEQSHSHHTTLDDAYAILGVSKNASDTDVKKAYRRLMNQHHPDKLVAKGLPEEMIKLATEKTQDIRKAYDLIKNKRKAQ